MRERLKEYNTVKALKEAGFVDRLFTTRVKRLVEELREEESACSDARRITRVVDVSEEPCVRDELIRYYLALLIDCAEEEVTIVSPNFDCRWWTRGYHVSQKGRREGAAMGSGALGCFCAEVGRDRAHVYQISESTFNVSCLLMEARNAEQRLWSRRGEKEICHIIADTHQSIGREMLRFGLRYPSAHFGFVVVDNKRSAMLLGNRAEFYFSDVPPVIKRSAEVLRRVVSLV